MWTTNRWLNMRTQAMCAFVAGLIAFAIVYKGETIGSTLAGLVLIYSAEFGTYQTYLIRMHAECQMSMNSVERIIEYCDIEQEQYVPKQRSESIGSEIEDVIPSSPPGSRAGMMSTL